MITEGPPGGTTPTPHSPDTGTISACHPVSAETLLLEGTAMTVRKTPAGLHAAGRGLWRAVLDAYDLDAHEELLLLQACRCADHLDRLAAEADAGTVTVTNHKGDAVAHPALTESRQQAITLARLLAALRMPTGETDAGLVRPQRRGAPRGAYGVRAVL